LAIFYRGSAGTIAIGQPLELPMRRYTMRRTWPEDDQPNDYVFKVDGTEAGRCYRHYMRFVEGNCWHWTVYGSGFAGDEPTLEAAQAKFKAAYERKVAT
jgi:hypothetical protein